MLKMLDEEICSHLYTRASESSALMLGDWYWLAVCISFQRSSVGFWSELYAGQTWFCSCLTKLFGSMHYYTCIFWNVYCMQICAHTLSLTNHMWCNLPWSVCVCVLVCICSVPAVVLILPSSLSIKLPVLCNCEVWAAVSGKLRRLLINEGTSYPFKEVNYTSSNKNELHWLNME